MSARRVYRDARCTDDMFVHAADEMKGYLNACVQRFTRTLDVIREAVPVGGRVLEIGANPYFVTAVLLKDLRLDVTSLGRPPIVWPGSPVQACEDHERYLRVDTEIFPIREAVCNAEKDPFPLADAQFDLVIAAEILEHLIFSPTHFLYEIHRVLKPGGHLVLTTPNAVQLRYLLKWISGRSVWDQYSGYGVYGRHQREYTAREIEELLQSLNFTVVQTDRYYARPLDSKLDGKLLEALYRVMPSRAPEMTFLARASGEPKVSYPDFLYRSLYPKPENVEAMRAFANRDGFNAVPTEQTTGATRSANARS
ncbi:MAG TPA: class I SAM-dependent methyltransferase [Polyangiaceae bacterium]|nr:class I SAM-dependent methyltransferase [Polyangiaceae bacterium]